MKRFRLPIFTLLAIGTIAACEKSDPVANEAGAIAPAPVTSNSAGPVAGGPPPLAANTSDDSGDTIPAALQGRWGLTPADCEPGRSDAKGLLTISATDLKFYESRAVPGTSIERGPKSISGNFDFAGEGERWSTYISFKLQNDGLVRTERNPAASYTYAKCD